MVDSPTTSSDGECFHEATVAIQYDRHMPHNHPDIICINYQARITYLIDVAIPGDARVTEKDINDRYTDLEIERGRCIVILPLVSWISPCMP